MEGLNLENFGSRNEEEKKKEAVLAGGMFESMEDGVVDVLRKEVFSTHQENPFHGPHHFENVLEASEKILDILGVKDTESRIANRLAALAHDLVLNKVKNIDSNAPFGYGQVVRARGWREDGSDVPIFAKDIASVGNERASYDRLVATVMDIDPDGFYYTDNILNLAKEAIAATYPEATMSVVPDGSEKIYNQQTGNHEDISDVLVKSKDGKNLALKFDQPYLTEDSGLNALAIAFGDLMAVGRVSTEEFKKEGNAEFRELNYLIADYVKQGIENLNSEQKVWIAKSCLDWVGTQAGFGLMQKIRFDEILSNNKELNSSKNSEYLKNKLYEEYHRFDENILFQADRKRRVEEKFGHLRKTESFDKPENDELLRELLEEMGYGVQN